MRSLSSRFFIFILIVMFTLLSVLPGYAAGSLYDEIMPYAEKGDAEAQFYAALYYYWGEDGFPEDAKESEKWGLASAKQGYVDAMVFLGEMYLYGDFYKQSNKDAYKWFLEAANEGSAYAQTQVGNCYYFGAGVDVDYNTAFEWYMKGAENGDLNAYYSLGVCYEFGDCAELDYTEAANWFRKGAEEGQVDCQTNYGLKLLDGSGVKQDNNEGAKWLRKAAAQGDEYAEDVLNDLLNTGTTVPGKLYTFDEKSHYEFSTAKQYKTIANADNAYGVFAFTGDLRDSDQKNGVPAYDVKSGSVEISYRYFDDMLTASKSDWHFVRDDSSVIDNIELDHDIRKGALVLQRSNNRTDWETVVSEVDIFSQTPIRVDSFYIPTDNELAAGYYYRAVIAYSVEKSSDEEKRAEVYEFYMYDSDAKSTQPTAEQPQQQTAQQQQQTPQPQKPQPQTGTSGSSNVYTFDTPVHKMKKDSGYSKEESLGKNDPHFGNTLGRFTMTGYSRTVYDPDDGTLTFLKNPGDEMKLQFTLDCDIDKLWGDDALKIDNDSNGYDKDYGIKQTDFGHGFLLIRHRTPTGTSKDAKYANFLEAKAIKKANVDVQTLEEGTYDVVLDYSILKSSFIGGVAKNRSDYQISFKFKVASGNCMVFLFDAATGSSLPNRSFTENGFRLDLANAQELTLDVKKQLLMDDANGLVLDPQFNRVVKDGQVYTDEGIYEITVKNRYSGSQTDFVVYVGNNSVLKAYIVTGLSIQEIRSRLEAGQIITEDGYLVNPTSKDGAK